MSYKKLQGSRHTPFISVLRGKLLALAGAATLAVLPSVSQAIMLGSISDVYVPGSVATIVKGINGLGEAVGEYYDTSGLSHGFYYDGSSYVTVARTSDNWNESWGINNSSTLVAGGQDAAGNYSGYYMSPPFTSNTPVIFSGQHWSELTGINDNNVMVGGYEDSAGVHHEFIFDSLTNAYTTLFVPGSKTTGAFDINSSNYVAGAYTDFSNVRHGYYFDGTNYVTINIPGSTFTEALGINDLNMVVGDYLSNGIYHGFLYDILNQTLTTIDLPGTTGTRLYDINNSLQLSGAAFYGTYNYGSPPSGSYRGYITAIVPLPAALVLFSSGLGLFGLLARRRTRTVAV